MTNHDDSLENTPTLAEYQPPVLVSIGDAADIVMGLPGGGWDGPFGMTEGAFEFLDDEP